MSDYQIHKEYCLVCVRRSPKAGLRYFWKATKQYYDSTMQHFDIFGDSNRRFNARHKYETRRYYEREFAHKGFWNKNSKYIGWRMRYQGNLKKLKLKGCY